MHFCLRTAYAMPGLCLPVLWFMSTNQLICYKICMHLNCNIWKFACYLHDVWSHWSSSCHPETSKEGHGTGVTLGNVPYRVWENCKEESWLHTILCCHISLIDGKWLLFRHTLSSNCISPLLNLTAQRKFCCLLLLRAGTKATTKTNAMSWSQYNSNSYSCASHCFLDYFANNKSNSSSRWHVSNFKFD